MREDFAKRIKVKNYLKGYAIFIGIFDAIAIIFGIVALINPMEEESMPLMGGVLIGLGLILIGLIFFLIKTSKKLQLTNTYPETALALDNDSLVIITDKETVVPLKDIKKVSGARQQNVGLFVRVLKTYGTLQIKTATEKYTLYQIQNVSEVAKALKKMLKNLKQN